MTHKLIRWFVGNPQITGTIKISQEARKFFRDPDFVIKGRRTKAHLIGAAFAAAMIASTPAHAWDGGRGGGHWHGGGGGWIAPFVGGAILGGALGVAPYYANPYPYSPYPYGYSSPYYPPQPRWCQDYYGRWYQC